MKKYKTLIIEDEQPARELIKKYLEDYPEFELLAEASDGFKGVQAINEHSPDVIFLDIQMPKLTGFEMLELIDPKPLIIFSTAFDQYAIKAFELNAIDYLLKPYSKDRFSQAISKLMDKIKEQKTGDEPIKKIVQSLEDSEDIINRVATRTARKIEVVPTDNIHYFEADDDYVLIYTKDAKFIKEKTMKYFERHLDPNQFVRIHRSFIANVTEINRLERYEKDSYVALMKSGSKLKVSASGYKNLRKVLDI